MQPLVSVVITTKNEEHNIGNCLESIKNQTYPQDKIEIIVVDNNSIDQTKKIAKKYTKKVYNFGPERSAQRNFGILKKAKGKYILFLDADMSLGLGLIEACVKELEHTNFIALYIPELMPGDSYWNQVRSFERSFYEGTVIDCVRFIKRKIFIQSGGFDTNLTGPEDWDLDKKIRNIGKTKVLHKNKAVIFHKEKNFTVTSYLKKKEYYMPSFKAYINKWGQNDPDIRRQFSMRYRYIKIFIEQGKWRVLISKPHLAVGMYVLKFIIGINYLQAK
jgi:glycosyltransferase involved in cell wall biosynthesis